MTIIIAEEIPAAILLARGTFHAERLGSVRDDAGALLLWNKGLSENNHTALEVDLVYLGKALLRKVL